MLRCMCQAWNSLRQFIQLQPPVAEEVHLLPIWNCPISTVHLMQLISSSVIAELLIGMGISRVVQLWNYNGQWWKTWEEVTWMLPSLWQRNGYITLLIALILPHAFSPTHITMHRLIGGEEEPSRIALVDGGGKSIISLSILSNL